MTENQAKPRFFLMMFFYWSVAEIWTNVVQLYSFFVVYLNEKQYLFWKTVNSYFLVLSGIYFMLTYFFFFLLKVSKLKTFHEFFFWKQKAAFCKIYGRFFLANPNVPCEIQAFIIFWNFLTFSSFLVEQVEDIFTSLWGK